ncbi:hypothetical protein P0Y43_18475 [Pseudomonas entomophila]|uniref:hypothetical protein n=1 Tax=Pseudomonas entomophila TaxID=312306 RepID=UPI0023D7EF1A|nr:hypothetical protein [Pseudomonas entomophila]MDF0732676.1 hypothetical protein [Pseudomonas entomophila]
MIESFTQQGATLDIQRFANVLREHFASRARTITRFAGTGYSFEEWLNWELFDAFTARGFDCHPKPAYRKVIGFYEIAALADLGVRGENGDYWLVEVALVHGYTLDKWRDKLVRDRSKLEAATGQGVRRLQLVFSCSDAEQALDKQWAYWFEAVPFWTQQNVQVCLSDGLEGEVHMKLWEVG